MRFGAGMAAPHLVDARVSQIEPDPQGAVPRPAQAGADRGGDRDAGDLVVQELPVAAAVQRQGADSPRRPG